MSILPCSHEPSALAQIAPTIDLLRNLDTRHPDVLRASGIVPQDYHPKRVFRSAIETIRGSFIASSITQRHQMVAAVLAGLVEGGTIATFEGTGRGTRHDFTVVLSNAPRVAAAYRVAFDLASRDVEWNCQWVAKPSKDCGL